MTRHDDLARLRHMLDHAMEIEHATSGRVRKDLDSDRQFNLAVVRLLEIVGEAAARVTDDTRSRVPEIPWLDIAGLRNRLIHGYDDVDFDILWDVLEMDIPPLITAIRSFLRDNDDHC